MIKLKIASLLVFLVLLAACAPGYESPPPPTPTPTPNPADIIAAAATEGNFTKVAIAFISWEGAMAVVGAIVAAAIVIWLGTLVTKRTNSPAVLIMVLFVAIVAAAIVSRIFWLWLIAILVAGMYLAYLFFSNKYTLRRAQFGGHSSWRKNNESRYAEIGSDEFVLTPDPAATPLTTSATLAERIDRIFNPGGDNELNHPEN